MNRAHTWLCRSELWARAVKDRLMPWVLEGVDLGEDVLEIGPGYGATTRVLVDRARALTAVEIDTHLASRLRGLFGERVRVVTGDGGDMPLDDATFSGVVCFTMLHHVPSPQQQDRLFAEAFRVLRPGGIFAGSDSVPTLGFRVLHLGDTMVLVDPSQVARRLEAVGFRDVGVEVFPKKSFKFRARKP